MSRFWGYRIKSVNINQVESILKNAKAKIAEAASEEYHRLLGIEIATLIDDITLNIQQRPNIPIFNAAINVLNEKISRAEAIGTGTEYDLRTGVTIIPDKGYTYLMLTASNSSLIPAFESTEGIENYTVDFSIKDKTEEQSARSKKWERLWKRNEDSPAILTSSLTTQIKPDPNKLTFPSKLDRASDRARHTITSRLLNQYACGQEIKPAQLMPLLDLALERILDDDIQRELDITIDNLCRILLDISLEITMKDPREPLTTGKNEPTPQKPEKNNENS